MTGSDRSVSIFRRWIEAITLLPEQYFKERFRKIDIGHIESLTEEGVDGTETVKGESGGSAGVHAEGVAAKDKYLARLES